MPLFRPLPYKLFCLYPLAVEQVTPTLDSPVSFQGGGQTNAAIVVLEPKVCIYACTASVTIWTVSVIVCSLLL